jgi:hypothetical protein
MIIQKKTEELQQGDVISLISDQRCYRRERVIRVETEPRPCVIAKIVTDRGWFYSGIHGIHNIEIDE